MEQLLKEILSEVKQLNNHIGQIENDFNQVKTDMDYFKIGINDVKNGLNNLEIGVNYLKSDLDFVKSELNFMKTDLNSTKSLLDENTDITKTIFHHQKFDKNLNHFSRDVQKLHEDVDTLKANHHSLQKEQVQIIDKIEHIKTHLQFNTQKITETELKIFKMKHK